ncbi:hypothetical protein GCM10022378_20650 [Salinicoccus jeotgali]|uniref:SCO family protein n=1 Tax=Salinicoccus jeotgali TaxID=381634 RepID=A0ABP7F9G2_9STAP
MKKDIISIIVILVLASLLFGISTDGFRIYTIEAERIESLKSEKPDFPDIEVMDNKGRTYPFDHFEGKHILMTFIYTSCSTACPRMEASMQEVYEKLDAVKHKDDLVFLSMSFDPERDTVPVLDRYADYFNADGETWRMLRVPESEDLEAALDTYGVTVIPEGDSDFQHNTSFYLIGPDGGLLEVLDYRDVDAAVEALEHRVGGAS